MRELLEFIALKLVDHPDQVIITEKNEDGFSQLNLRVAPDDMGKIIGKEGKIIKSLRHLLRVKAIIDKKKVSLNLEDQDLPH